MSANKKIDEIIELIIMLQNSYSGLTTSDIAEHFECSKRTAERMMSAIGEKYGAYIETVQNKTDNKKRRRLKKGSLNSLIKFNSDDFALLEHYKNCEKSNAKKKELSAIIEKIKAINPDKFSKNDVDELLLNQAYCAHIGFREDISIDILTTINEAILSQKQIKIDKKYLINPYGLIYGEKIYLVAYNPFAQYIWIYRISKLKEIELTNNYFEKDENFNIQEFSDKSFGIYQGEITDVVLEFEKCAKDDVMEYHFHKSQKITPLENGKIQVSLRASGNYEIITELLKWRDCVKIISPKSLKDEYIKTVENMYNSIKKGNQDDIKRSKKRNYKAFKRKK